MDALSSISRVSSLFKEVKLDSTTDQAGLLKLFEELKEAYEAQESAAPAAEYAVEYDEELKQLCTQASLLFVARVLFVAQSAETRRVPANLGCPISRIVASAGINLLDFFREVNLVVSKLSTYFEAKGGSSRLFTQQAHLKENSETVVVMGLLAKKYKDSFNMFLHQLDIYKQIALKLGWSAFLFLRVKLLSAFPDVVSCVELLPCVFAILASHAPRLPDCLSHLSHGEAKPGLLKTISEMCKADYGRVQARMPSVEALLLQTLGGAVPEWRVAVSTAKLQATQAAATGPSALTFAGASDLVSNPMLEGLVTDADRMQRALAALEAEYEQYFAFGGSELDEREFLHTDFTKFASPRFSPGHMHSAMTRLRADPIPLRQGALLGPGAHTTAPSAVSPHLLHIKMPMPAGMHSPLPMLHLGMDAGQPNTPVSEVMSASAWLRRVTADLAAEPSPGLQRYLAAVSVPAAGPDSTCTAWSSAATQQLGRRVQDLVSSIMPDDKIPSLLGPFPLLQTSLSMERRAEITKLYYYSLDNILQSEEKASGLAGAVSLLSAGKFHRALVACCAEVVAACYRMVSCAFPKVLDALHIKAFDLAKMIQSFVKSIATLPRELKRHLFLIEERILESLAWEPGSSLYHHIIYHVNRVDDVLPSTITEAAASTAALKDAPQRYGDGSVAGLTLQSGASNEKSATPPKELADSGAVPMDTVGATVQVSDVMLPVSSPLPKRPKSCTLFGVMSPAKKARGVDGSPQPTQLHTEKLPQSIGIELSTEPGGSSGVLHDFCRKVLKLAAFRLAFMCDNFDFSPLDRVEVNTKVYETIEHALYCQTHLFYNRHIDQIVLSALYGYCKVHKLSQVSFREIIAHYRKQPQAQQPIFRSVIIEQSNPGLQVVSRADIIAFYNQVFVPAMKSFLLKGESCGAGTNRNCTVSTAGGAGAVGDREDPAVLPLIPCSPRTTKLSSRPPSDCILRGAVRQKSQPGSAADAAKHGGGDEAAEDAVLSHHVPIGSTLYPVFKGDSSSQVMPGSEVGIYPSTASTNISSAGPVPARVSSVRLRSAGAPVEHQIPDGLAALLQALDSQHGGVVKESDTECPADDDEAASSGRAGENDDMAQMHHLPAERRTVRRYERGEVTRKESGPDAVAELPKSLPGRRQRILSRRYGTD